MGFLKMIGLVVVVLVLGFWLPFLFRVLPWWCRDIYKYFKYPRKIHLYGIWLYCGLYGQGKTMALTEYLTRMRKKYGDKIYEEIYQMEKQLYLVEFEDNTGATVGDTANIQAGYQNYDI